MKTKPTATVPPSKPSSDDKSINDPKAAFRKLQPFGGKQPVPYQDLEEEDPEAYRTTQDHPRYGKGSDEPTP